MLALVAVSANATMDAADSNAPNTPDMPLSHVAGLPGGDLLARAASANRDLYASLQSFVCSELIDRYKGRIGSESVRHLDTVSVKVSLENGTEHYSDVREKNRPLRDLTSLDGAWSEGEFGTLLQQSEQLLRTQSTVIDGAADLNGAPAVMLHFDVAATDSPWDLEVGGQHYFIAFRTRLWLSEASGDILKIERTSTNIPNGLRIAQIAWSVTLGPVDLNGKQWLLPSTGDYQVIYRDGGRREWNTLTFSGYHRYGAEVKLHFE
ncbi:MAG: hypothetical protein M3Y72_19900 [Acidobacteriota bacterium]|nr:hypothetical protein [Acidobacteriota bacterium]